MTKHHQRTVAAIVASVVSTAPALAEVKDETVALLLKRIEQLENKVASLEHPAVAPASPSLAAPASQRSQATPDAGNVATPNAASTAGSKSAPIVTVGTEGLLVRSADTNFIIKVRGLAQVDSRWLINNGGSSPTDTFLLRRARLISEGTFYRDLDYQVVTEFGGGTAAAQSPTILDANLAYRLAPAFQIKAGKFKAPVGLEVLQQDRDRSFVESGLPTQLVPNRDLGVQLGGELLDGRVSYAVGVFNGTSDNTNANNTDGDGRKEIAGRIFAQPFAKSGNDWVRGLGLGVGGSFGGTTTAGNLPNGGKGTYVTDTQQTWFTYKSGLAGDTTGVVPDGTHWRISPQGYYYKGGLGILGEYVVSDQRYRAGNGTSAVPFKSATLDNTAWQIAVGYVLTGEAASYRGVKPKHDFSLAEGTWGAVEALARYSVLNVDANAFNGFADATKSARDAHALTLGINWYLNRNLRASIDYTLTDFDGGNGVAGNKRSENAILTRFQVAF